MLCGRRGLFIYDVTILMYLQGRGEPAQHHTIKLKDHQLWAKPIYGWLRIKQIRKRHKLLLSLQHPLHPTALTLLSGGQLAQDCTPTGLESGEAVGAGVAAHSFALVL